MFYFVQEKMVISLRSFGGEELSFPFSPLYYLDIHLLCLVSVCFIYMDDSTKDPGQKPFSFKIGQGSVIKGKC